MIQCERGHFYDESRYSSCPYCSQVSVAPRSVTPPVAPNMEIPTPSCGKTVAVEGVETAPSVGKTVAIDMPAEQFAPINKTVAISEPPLDFPPVTPIAPPAPAYTPSPAQAPVAQAPVQAPVAPAPIPTPAVPAAAPAIADIPVSAPVSAPIAPAPQVPAQPAAASYAEDMNAGIPYNGVSETPERILTEQISIDLPVTGLGVSDHPKPILQEEKFYQSSPDRPYAVTGLGVKENPTPIPNDVGATFPIPSDGSSASSSAQPGQAEAVAFAAFGFPGGPMPGMVPGVPMPGAPAAPQAPAAPAVTDPVEEKVQETSVSEAAPQISVSETVSETPASEAVPDFPSTEPAEIPVDAPSPVIEEPKPSDPNATVALTESDMDFIPRVHARAFLVGIDGPMTGASYVFQESRAVIGRQKNYEISLYRDNSVSRSPHAILTYNKDALRYAVAPGDADKKVSVNGAFIEGETELKLYDVIGVGQSRLLFIPVCSEKFAW
ncbi:MAG: hypothetical protein IJK65_00385 [Clostridiales bacterium]|nr:hypothetical protein [Clostridiales bacterium]MBR4009662.1 hypothetical protein [Clostridiales bacterium]